MGGLRVRKTGERTHVISPTIPDDVHKMVKRMAIEYEGTMSSTVRVAITLGLDRMDKELRKRDAGEPDRCDRIKGMIGTDGRTRTEETDKADVPEVMV